MPHSEVSCRGGAAYGEKSYVIRVTDGLTTIPGENTEALLVKRGGATDLENIVIRTQNGTTYSSVRDYLLENSVMSPYSFPEYGNGFNCIEFCLGDTWTNGGPFYTNTQPSTDTLDTMPDFAFEEEPEPELGRIIDESRPPRQNAESCLPPIEEDYPLVDDTSPIPVDRSMTDCGGDDEKFRIRFQPLDGVMRPGTWAGFGTISRSGNFQNRLTRNDYSMYEIVLDHYAYTPHNDLVQYLHSVNDFLEIALRTKNLPKDKHGWHYLMVEIDGEWVDGITAAKYLFNITIGRNTSGRLVEVFGEHPFNY